MTYQRALKLCHELVNNNRRVQQLLDDILDNAVNPEEFESREDWSQVKKTVELFTYTGLVLEPHCPNCDELSQQVAAAPASNVARRAKETPGPASR